MNLQDMKDKYFNKQFIIFYLIVFFILYVLCSFIKFIGQLPILRVITFFITYYLNNIFGNKIQEFVNTNNKKNSTC